MFERTSPQSMQPGDVAWGRNHVEEDLDTINQKSFMHELPFELLVLIMQTLPQQERLGVCALVCTAWWQAAVAATTCVGISCASQARCTSLAAWLQKPGRACAVESLRISSGVADYEHQPTLLVPVNSLLGLQRLMLDRSNLALVHTSPPAIAASQYGPAPASACLQGASAAAAAALCGLPATITASAAAGNHSIAASSRAATAHICRGTTGLSQPAASATGASAALHTASATALSSFMHSAPPSPTRQGSGSTPKAPRLLSAAAAAAASATAAGACASLESLTSLTELRLRDCFMAAEGLQHLTSLQCLELALLVLPGDWVDLDDAAGRLAQCEAVVRDGIKALTQLTHLTLGGMYCTDVVVAEVSCLLQLQQLCLFAPEVSAEAFKLDLPSSLTKLDITAGADPYRFHYELHPADLCISVEDTPAITNLTSLQHLRLGAVYLHPEALASLAQLTALELCSCSLLGADEAQAAALTALSSLTGLQRLTFGCWPPGEGAQWTAADFAALTASTQLTYLDLRGSRGLVVPVVSNGCVNSSSSVQSNTTSSSNSNSSSSSSSSIHSTGPTTDDGRASVCSSGCSCRAAGRPAVVAAAGRSRLRELHVPCELLADAAAVSRLVSCWPHLLQLSISTNSQARRPHSVSGLQLPGVRECTLQGLQHLESLQALLLKDVQIEAPAESVAALQQLRELRELRATGVRGFGLGRLLQLSAIRSLVQLEFQADEAVGWDVKLHSQAPAGAAPDVWCQLPRVILQQLHPALTPAANMTHQ